MKSEISKEKDAVDILKVKQDIVKTKVEVSKLRSDIKKQKSDVLKQTLESKEIERRLISPTFLDHVSLCDKVLLLEKIMTATIGDIKPLYGPDELFEFKAKMLELVKKF